MPSALQRLVALPLLKELQLSSFEFLALRLPLSFLQVAYLHVQLLALDVLFWRKSVSESSVSHFGLLVSEAVYRSQCFVHQASLLFLSHVFAFQALPAERVHSLGRGHVHPLRA